MDLLLVLKATTDDPEPTAGYLFGEIKKYVVSTRGRVASGMAVDALLNRCKNKSAFVRAKALRVLRHLVTPAPGTTTLGEAESQVLERLEAKANDFLRPCVHYSAPPHPSLGDKPVADVKEEAARLMELLYRGPKQLNYASSSSSSSSSYTPASFTGRSNVVIPSVAAAASSSTSSSSSSSTMSRPKNTWGLGPSAAVARETEVKAAVNRGPGPLDNVLGGDSTMARLVDRLKNHSSPQERAEEFARIAKQMECGVAAQCAKAIRLADVLVHGNVPGAADFFGKTAAGGASVSTSAPLIDLLGGGEQQQHQGGEGGGMFSGLDTTEVSQYSAADLLDLGITVSPNGSVSRVVPSSSAFDDLLGGGATSSSTTAFPFMMNTVAAAPPQQHMGGLLDGLETTPITTSQPSQSSSAFDFISAMTPTTTTAQQQQQPSSAFGFTTTSSSISNNNTPNQTSSAFGFLATTPQSTQQQQQQQRPSASAFGFVSSSSQPSSTSTASAFGFVASVPPTPVSSNVTQSSAFSFTTKTTTTTTTTTTTPSRGWDFIKDEVSTAAQRK